MKLLECGNYRLQQLGVKRPEALVQEKELKRVSSAQLDLRGKRQRQRKRSKKRFPAGQRADRPPVAAVRVVTDYEAASGVNLKRIPPLRKEAQTFGRRPAHLHELLL